MKKASQILNSLFLSMLFVVSAYAQKGYDITIKMKGCNDSMVYLVKYIFDQQYITDTCKNIKDGLIRFKGQDPLDKGIYTLVSQGKSVYFDFFINDSFKFTITTDKSDIISNLKCTGSKDNEQFFSYLKFISDKNKQFGTLRDQTKGLNASDSTAYMKRNLDRLNEEVKTFDQNFMTRSKGTYVYDVMNLKTEKEAKDLPKAKNNRPDSIYAYYYYKSHFFDGIDFKDERIIRTPFFDDRIIRYFDQVILQHPDTIIQEIDKLILKCPENELIYNLLIGHFTYKYEQSKIMGFDKIFVHLADKFIISGRAEKVYADETVAKIKERVDVLRNLLLDSRVPDLFAIDTTYGGVVRKMGFDTASSSKSITDLYYKNIDKITPLFKTLYGIKAKYTVLVFWAADCGHCQTEVPKLHEELGALKSKLDFKVLAVQTKDELYKDWKKFIIEKKLKDFIHVFDPIHINNLKEKFDIYSTPVIYILDSEKRIKAKRLGAEQVPQMLQTLEQIESAK